MYNIPPEKQGVVKKYLSNEKKVINESCELENSAGKNLWYNVIAMVHFHGYMKASFFVYSVNLNT